MNSTISMLDLRRQLQSPTPPLLLDVRRAPTYEKACDKMAHATWMDPALVLQWGALLDPATAVVVYCVHGHEVIQGCTQTLQSLGLTAHFLEGGIEGWRDAGGELVPIDSCRGA